MYELVNIDAWKRKAHYEFFKEYDDPFYGVTVDIDCTNAYAISKSLATSFFLFYLHKSIRAVNEVPAFKLRIVDDELRIYNQINASSTIHRPDGTFGFSHIPYNKSYPPFAQAGKKEIARVQQRKDLEPMDDLHNVIFYSSLPWISFTSLSHARRSKTRGSTPMITFGKMKEISGRKYLPMSVHVHHALVDGKHIGQYVDRFQDLMNNIK